MCITLSLICLLWVWVNSGWLPKYKRNIRVVTLCLWKRTWRPNSCNIGWIDIGNTWCETGRVFSHCTVRVAGVTRWCFWSIVLEARVWALFWAVSVDTIMDSKETSLFTIHDTIMWTITKRVKCSRNWSRKIWNGKRCVSATINETLVLFVAVWDIYCKLLFDIKGTVINV